MLIRFYFVRSSRSDREPISRPDRSSPPAAVDGTDAGGSGPENAQRSPTSLRSTSVGSGSTRERPTPGFVLLRRLPVLVSTVA
ncbi:hypothetical protein EA472_10285 [Natrarchaeobius oligotrophus]|uniref:Uncharacterized protein n=1 Tax=Natrarchaeobius chitinivorans TaxID=1679083 RepID=A0A3N6PHS1_NATCH|nr:hypothetical protein EA472_10285 [Natrarchaeobius chitinivorans]